MHNTLLNFSNVFQVVIAVTRYMLISHFSLYMKCFTKPLIAATLLAVWLFSFGWMVGISWEDFFTISNAGATTAVGVGHLGGGQGDLHLHNQAGRQGQVLLPGIISGD